MIGRHKLALIIALLLLVLDQISKWWALAYVAPSWPIEVTSFFNLVLVWNTGVSFGLFNEGGETGKWLLIGVALAISVMVSVWLWREQSRLLGFAYALIVSGAIGNVIDRLRFGAVVDFLDFHVLGFHWPAFNVADSAIVVGAALIAFSLFVPVNINDNEQSETRGSS